MPIQRLYERYPDVHANIVLKTDILRQGIDVSEAALANFRNRDDLLWKGYHLFSYDFKKTKVYGDKIPWVMHFEDGCPVMIRTDDTSPYLLDCTDDGFVVRAHGEIVAENVWFERKPRWYDMKTEGGVPMGAIANGIVDLIFVTANKICGFWNNQGKSEECLFCNINETTHDQKKGGEGIVARAHGELIAEVVKTAFATDHQYRMLFLTGGTILTTYKGQSELDYYTGILKEIRKKLGAMIPTAFQIVPYDDEGWKRIHDTGAVASIQPNIEVWDKKLFEWICPGKNRYIGYDEWIKRTIRAVDFWGPGQVNPNFVVGIEMAQPHGFTEVGAAVRSTAAGWDFLMSHGVLPRYNLWTQEAGSAFVDQTSPPLDYFIEIQKAYAELRSKHKFDPPFPGGMSRYSYCLNSLQDFEYYHGTGTTSKKNLDARLGVPSGSMGGREDAFGYTLA